MADVHAKWKNINICYCGTDNFFTTNIRWIEVPMMDESTKSVLNIERISLGILTLGLTELVGAVAAEGFHDVTHECVEIDFTCKDCGKTFKRTYEIDTSGIKRYWGYYAKEYQCERSSSYRRSFEFIESKYETMWSNYSVIEGRHCKRWSKDFFWKIE